MSQSDIAKNLKALFNLENNIKVESILEAYREDALQQSKRLEALASALANKPSRSSMRTLAEEAFAIRKEVLNSAMNLLMRLKPALTHEQFSTYETQFKELQSKNLQSTSNGYLHISAEDAHPELIPLENRSTDPQNSAPVRETAATDPADSTQSSVSPNLPETNNPDSQALLQSTN
jgi:hypothetical protein